MQAISRSKGRSSVAAAAYRAGVAITDERTGESFDYTPRTKARSVVEAYVIAPFDSVTGRSAAADWVYDRAQLWNAAEARERRKDSTVAREIEIAIPAELDDNAAHHLGRAFGGYLAGRFGVAVDVARHVAPSAGDRRNRHIHCLMTTRAITPGGFGAKTAELDNRYSGAVTEIRAEYGRLANEALERAQSPTRVDHRTLAAQGIDRLPGIHLGAAVGMERKTPSIRTRIGDRHREAMSINSERADLTRQLAAARAAENDQIERAIAAAEVDRIANLAAAKAQAAAVPLAQPAPFDHDAGADAQRATNNPARTSRPAPRQPASSPPAGASQATPAKAAIPAAAKAVQVPARAAPQPSAAVQREDARNRAALAARFAATALRSDDPAGPNPLAILADLAAKRTAVRTPPAATKAVRTPPDLPAPAAPSTASLPAPAKPLERPAARLPVFDADRGSARPAVQATSPRPSITDSVQKLQGTPLTAAPPIPATPPPTTSAQPAEPPPVARVGHAASVPPPPSIRTDIPADLAAAFAKHPTTEWHTAVVFHYVLSGDKEAQNKALIGWRNDLSPTLGRDGASSAIAHTFKLAQGWLASLGPLGVDRFRSWIDRAIRTALSPRRLAQRNQTRPTNITPPTRNPEPEGR